MIPTEALHLLEQDNSIPGNRKDGFRYRHLLFIIVVTPIYLWFELSFGVRLLDGISSGITPADPGAIEHWGRLISGCAVSLLVLSGWLRQCEKQDIAWPARILVAVAICVACIMVTWWVEGQVIDFYVHRSTGDITLALTFLLALVIAGFLIVRVWLRYAVRGQQFDSRRVIAGLVVILAASYVLMQSVSAVLPKHPEHVGLERQRAATLTLVRNGIQHGYYGPIGEGLDERAMASPEGKAFLALFPVFGRVLDQERFARDRPFLVSETMYRDWDEQRGKQAFAAFQDVAHRVKTTAFDEYAAASQAYLSDTRTAGIAAAKVRWDAAVRRLLDGEAITPGLTREAFLRDPAINRYMRGKLGCFDCEFNVDMDRQSFGREYFKWTQANNVRQAVETFGSARYFESGRDGERAARTYWVPIWALLFSMLGAFTNFFKLVVTTMEYAHRVTFDRIKASDSMLANQIISNSRNVTAAVVIGMALFIYFADNRITAHERYVEMHTRMWRSSPLVGAIAAHWTVNAQALLYPFTRRIRPSWLTFDEDPVAKVPFASAWLSRDDEQGRSSP